MDTIYGSGFSAKADEDSIYFNGLRANVWLASETKLVVEVPTGVTTGNVTLKVNGKSATGPQFTVIADSVIVTTLAGTGISDSTNGPRWLASFRMPWDIAADSEGNIYVADGGDNSIRKISTSGTVSIVAGGGGPPSGWGPGTQFYNPQGIAVDENNNIYVADTDRNRIRKITGAGTVVTIAGNGANGSLDGAGQGAYFFQPVSMVTDKQGNIYLTEYGNHLIRKITPAGIVSTVAGGTTGGYNDGTGTDARFRIPRGITIDDDGNLYVADFGNNRIRKITPAGVVTTIAGHQNGGSFDGQGTAAGLGHPFGITRDKQGNLFVTQYSTNKVRKISPSGWVSTVAGTGAEGSTDGPGRQSTFKGLVGIAIDKFGNLYVAEQGNYKVRKITRK